MRTTIFTFATLILSNIAYADIHERSSYASNNLSDVIVHERDKGIYGGSRVRVRSGDRSLLDATNVLFPSELAIATNGMIAVYSFGGQSGYEDRSFPQR